MRWFAVRVGTRTEARLIRDMAELGVQTYCPAETRWVTHARQTIRKDRPLLPGYIFAHLSEAHIWRVMRLHGVLGIVGAGGSPMPVPDRFIGLLAFHEWLGAFDQTMPYTELKLTPTLGMKLRVTKGPLTGMIGTVANGKFNDNQLRLMIDGFNQSRPYTVKVDAVEAVPCETSSSAP